ncbi:hypothetical protein [Actinoplanes sp. NPDC051851]
MKASTFTGLVAALAVAIGFWAAPVPGSRTLASDAGPAVIVETPGGTAAP